MSFLLSSKKLIKNSIIPSYTFFKNNMFYVLCFMFLYLVVTNIFFWAGDIFLHTKRPFINIDYFLVASFFFVRSKCIKFVGLFLFLFLFLVDLVLWSRQFFPFMRLSDLAYFSKVFFLGPSVYKVYSIGLIFVFMLQAWLVGKAAVFFSYKYNISFKKVLLASFFSFILVYSFYSPDESENTLYANNGILESQVGYAYGLHNNFFYSKFSWTSKLNPAKYHGATFPFFEKKEVPPRLLLIIVESWGVAKSKKINDFMMEGVLSKKSIFSDFSFGEKKFIGATVSAELRELCNLNVDNFNLKSIKSGWDQCLGNSLKKKGYTTYGVHAANGMMYDRSYWYKKSGLDNTIFFENIIDPIRCYSFPGACDYNLYPMVSNLFKNENEKIFVSWMTLNSHYPYDRRDLKNNHMNCVALDLSDESEACRLVYLQHQFFEGLGQMLQSPNMKGVHVIIIGDHEPPIIKKVDGDVFKESKVSWIEFDVKL